MNASPGTDEGSSLAGRRTWLQVTDGERQAIRVLGTDTGGAYAVIESVAAPDYAVPTHLHRNEEEHFLVIEGRYLIAIGDEVFNAPAGFRATVPRNTAHSWRNVAPHESRLLTVLTPGGFEEIAFRAEHCPPEEIVALAARFGCDILGPPSV